MNVQPGERVTVFDVVDCCTRFGHVSPVLSHAAWITIIIEDADHGGVGGGAWQCDVEDEDEGVTWIRGWHTPSEPEATALLAAGLLVRSAA